MTEKPIKGRWAAGKSGNPAGRPPKKAIAADLVENIPYEQLINAKDTLEKSMAYYRMTNQIDLATEVAAKLIRYQAAPISSIDLDQQEEKEFVIKWDKPDMSVLRPDKKAT